VSADVHAVALVADSPGDASDVVTRLDDNGLDSGLPLQLDGSGQSGGACSDDDCCSLFDDVYLSLQKNGTKLHAGICISLYQPADRRFRPAGRLAAFYPFVRTATTMSLMGRHFPATSIFEIIRQSRLLLRSPDDCFGHGRMVQSWSRAAAVRAAATRLIIGCMFALTRRSSLPLRAIAVSAAVSRLNGH
jgi:hypothetical protein